MQAVFEGVVHGEFNVPLRDGVKKEIEKLAAEKSILQKELRRFIPESTSSIILLDDEDSGSSGVPQKTAARGPTRRVLIAATSTIRVTPSARPT